MSEITVKRYQPCDKETWNSFNSSAKNSLFMFDRNYMDYHSDRFADHSLMFYDEKELIALLPMNEKDGNLISHGGLTYGGMICGNGMKQSMMMECFNALRVYMRSSSLRDLTYKCIPFIFWKQPAEEDQYALYRNGARLKKIEASTVINLKNPPEMAKLRKRMIKKALKEEIKVSEETGKESYREFIELQNKVLMEHHGVNAVHTFEELYRLHTGFPENVRLITARSNGILTAGTVLFEYDSVIHTQYLAASDEARKCGALDLVISAVIERYRDSKDWLDFGISTEHDGTLLNEGLISQKEGFGGRSMVYKTWVMSA